MDLLITPNKRIETQQTEVMFTDKGIAFATDKQEFIPDKAQQLRGYTNPRTHETNLVYSYKRKFKLPVDIDVWGLTEGQLCRLEISIFSRRIVNYPIWTPLIIRNEKMATLAEINEALGTEYITVGEAKKLSQEDWDKVIAFHAPKSEEVEKPKRKRKAVVKSE